MGRWGVELWVEEVEVEWVRARKVGGLGMWLDGVEWERLREAVCLLYGWMELRKRLKDVVCLSCDWRCLSGRIRRTRYARCFCEKWLLEQ